MVGIIVSNGNHSITDGGSISSRKTSVSAEDADRLAHWQ